MVSHFHPEVRHLAGTTMAISSLNSGLSGMQAFQSALDTSAHNVANLDTNGFKPQQANFQEQPNGGVSVQVSGGPQAGQGTPVTTSPTAPTTAASAQGTTSATASDTPSGTDFAKEAVDQLEYKYGFDMSAQVIKTTDHMLGTLINTTA